MKKTHKFLAAMLCAAIMLTGCAGQEVITVDSQPQSSVSSNTDMPSAPQESSAAATTPAVSQESTPDETTAGTSAAEPDSTESSSAATTASSASQATDDTTPPEPTTTPAEVTTTKAATSQSTQVVSDPKKEKYSVDWKLSSTWSEGGYCCGGYEVTITNNSGSEINGWKAQFAVPDGFQFSNSWNGNFSINGKTATVTNVDYNGTIPNGGSTGFGFNYKSPDEFSVPSVTINGSASQSGGGSADNPPAATTSVTTAKPLPPAPADPDGSTPVATHGQLSVKGTQLVDKNGNAYQLRGMSTHGITWFPDFVNESAFKTLRDDWHTNVIRIAMYIDEWGNGLCYMNNKQQSINMLEKGVDLAIKLDMYVIIDWHILNPGNPASYTNEAIEFFKSVTEKYKDYPNILYEICNEPNGNADWDSTIKPYAEKIIPIIRERDKDAVIIVGTPTWSQDIDKALANPLDFDNVMYALHFYSATHTDWLRDRVKKCVNSGLPVFVSEFGCCDASGNGANDFGQTEKWLSLLDSYGISYCNWALANKDESCCAIRPNASANGNWKESDLTESGAWIRKWFRSK